ncbi:hypothetical protein SBF1_170011 [Candidatus Desulfosporosinus infrequens]|uniref:Uncharacterized protein n=1 Tax=Candidatus Desulfosporosinus infrequens TaxID=2043169 RepID=A0A2U3KB39_9FIRM|nr:hypothetical protein SBF1_170011 [Candidatus Desulfosporosinus infrequens]
MLVKEFLLVVKVKNGAATNHHNIAVGKRIRDLKRWVKRIKISDYNYSHVYRETILSFN